MKYEYKSGRNIIPDGIKSDSLKCFECGESQSRSYCTEDGKNICFSCKIKDEKGELPMENNDKNFIVFLYNMLREADTKMSNKSNNDILTDHENGYQKCLRDMIYHINDYMSMDEERFYPRK